jgi:hypothetical protein
MWNYDDLCAYIHKGRYIGVLMVVDDDDDDDDGLGETQAHKFTLVMC